MLPKRTAGAELGTWRGDNAAALLRRARPAVLYLIDPWARQTDCERAIYGAGSGGQAEMDAIYAAVVKRFAGDERVIIKRQTSVEAARSFTPGCLTWAYIDGDHRYEAVREDLDLYSRVVHPGGYLAGEDYGLNGRRDEGVRRAVDEFVAAGRAADFLVRGTLFLIRLP
jgi:Methyltransferase domain